MAITSSLTVSLGGILTEVTSPTSGLRIVKKSNSGVNFGGIKLKSSGREKDDGRKVSQ
jgi:hypothetical protein